MIVYSLSDDRERYIAVPLDGHHVENQLVTNSAVGLVLVGGNKVPGKVPVEVSEPDVTLFQII